MRLTSKTVRSYGEPLVVFLLVYAVSLALRLPEMAAWDNASFNVAGEKIMATADAYFWMAGAEGVGRAANMPLAHYLRILHDISGIGVAEPAFWTPAILAGIIALPLCLLARLERIPEAGLFAGILGSSCIGFLERTRLGYFDTDIMALLFPVLLTTGLIAWLKPYIRDTWAPKQDTFPQDNPAMRAGPVMAKGFL
ncbi:MAG: hypothetical protein GY850_07990, partial [bacterium]|nr:hypothetical protein [bacterium]